MPENIHQSTDSRLIDSECAGWERILDVVEYKKVFKLLQIEQQLVERI